MNILQEHLLDSQSYSYKLCGGYSTRLSEEATYFFLFLGDLHYRGDCLTIFIQEEEL